MSELATSVSLSDEEKTTGTSRPKQGSGSRMYANFRSAIASIWIYRRSTLLAIFVLFVGALLVMVSDVLLQGANAQIVTLLFIIIGGISFIASVVIMVSILLVAGIGRAREFSLRLVLGARRRDIRNQLLFEALLLSGMGGISGSICGVLLGFGLTFRFHRPFSLNFVMLFLLVGVSVVPGIVCGLYQASRVIHLDMERVLRV